MQSLSFYVTTVAGKLRLGIYDATRPSGGPGTKKAETNEITPVANSWNSANVLTPVSLPSGNYWIAYLPSSSSLAFKSNGPGTTRYYSYAYGIMPATFSTSPATCNCHWSFYATLQPSVPAVTIDSFTASPSSIQTGQSSTLSWTTSNATSVTLDGAAVNLSGSQTVSPTQSTSYTLVAQGQGGPKSATVTIPVGSNLGFWERKTCPAPPQTDVVLNPGDNIQAAIDGHAQGTSFLLKAGMYQNQSITLKDGDKLYGELGTNCHPLTILNGGRTLTNFQQSGGLYYVTGQTQQGERIISSGDPGGRTCLPGYPRCNYPEDVFIDNVPLKAVDTLAGVVPGTFFFDYDADRIYIADNPAGHTVETTLNSQGIVMASNSTIRGLLIEKYATPYAVVGIDDTSNVTIEFNEIRLSHDYAISNWEPQSVRVANNFIHHMGCGGGWIGQDNNSNVLGGMFEGNEISYNNFEHWDTWDNPKFWEANGSVVRGNCIHNNYGTAIWSDTLNRNLTYESNIVFDNTIFLDARAAVFDYGADGNTVRYNAIGRNVWEGDFTTGDTGDGAGVATEGSAHMNVYNNYIEVATDRANGIAFNNYLAGGGGAGPSVITGNNIHNNEVTYLGSNGRSGVNGATSGTTFNNNLYHVTNLKGGHFQWGWSTLTFSQFQAAGAEANGNIDTNVTPLNWSCDMPMPAIAVAP